MAIALVLMLFSCMPHSRLVLPKFCLLFVPKDDITILDMGVEDAAKLVISAGLVAPEYKEVTQKMATGEVTPPPPQQ